MSFYNDVIAEKDRLVREKYLTTDSIDCFKEGEISSAAICYVLHWLNISHSAYASTAHKLVTYLWPFSRIYWKPKDRRHDLVHATALLILEGERLDRLHSSNKHIDG